MPAPKAMPPVRQTWAEHAACRSDHDSDRELFFDQEGESRAIKQIREFYAKQLCDSCPVAEDCLEEHIEERNGIFGGTDPDERKLLRRRRQRRESAARTRAKAS